MKHICIILLLFLSCSHEKNITNNVSIDCSDPKGTAHEMFFDYYSVALETIEDNLISSIDKIEIVDDRYYILDKKNSVIYVFSKNGLYLSKIDRKGNGPDEYLDITDFSVVDSKLYILSRIGRKIIVYSESDSMINQYRLDDYYDYMHIENEDLFLYSNYSNDKLYNIIIAKFDDGLIRYKKELLPFKKNQNFSFPPSPLNRASDGGVFLCQQYDNTIYYLGSDSISALYKLDFNTKDKIPKNYEEIGFDRMYKEFSNKSIVTRIQHVGASDKYLYLLYNFDYKRCIARINKLLLTSEVAVLEYCEEYPFVFSQPLTFHEGCLVGYLESANVLLFDKDFITNRNEKLSEEDNPVLFFHRIQ